MSDINDMIIVTYFIKLNGGNYKKFSKIKIIKIIIFIGIPYNNFLNLFSCYFFKLKNFIALIIHYKC